MSENELEDILSCDDTVLNDVYQYWTPPIRRLPPLLLVRIKTDLKQYLGEYFCNNSNAKPSENIQHKYYQLELVKNTFLMVIYCHLIQVERGADGVRVIFWYHRQFMEVARSLYCTRETEEEMETNIADYFLSKWSNGKFMCVLGSSHTKRMRKRSRNFPLNFHVARCELLHRN